MQFLSLIQILIILLYLLVSIELANNGFRELVLGVYPEGDSLSSRTYSNCSGAETTSSFSTYK